MMKLLINNFEDELRELAASATEIKVLIAFLTEGGLTWLPEEKMPCSDFIVGTDLGITTPDALHTLQSGSAGLQVFKDPGRLFHPKAIYLKSDEAEHLIVGSNNLTSAGISSNYELATQSERSSDTEEAFVNFLAHFKFLKEHPCCFVPGNSFFESYRPSLIQSDLASRQTTPSFNRDAAESKPAITIDPSATSSLRAFLSVLAKEFPRLDRRQGLEISGHLLKVAHDEEFRPLFDEIVNEASQERLEAESNLNIGGKWYRIPNLFAFDNDREPWPKTESTGRIGLQIHFSGGEQHYDSVYFSIVLMFVVPRTNREGTMTEPVARRHERLLNYLRGYTSDTRIDGPGFKHWDLESNRMLWSKPLVTFAYEIDSLPEEWKLRSDLEILSTALNGAMVIR